MSAVVIVYIDEDGNQDCKIIGDGVRVFTVDKRAPHDRVYEMLHRDDPKVFRELIPEGSEIGSMADERHAAIAARIKGERFTVIDGGADEDESVWIDRSRQNARLYAAGEDVFFDELDEKPPSAHPRPIGNDDGQD